mgnify:CR=1 FL=1
MIIVELSNTYCNVLGSTTVGGADPPIALILTNCLRTFFKIKQITETSVFYITSVSENLKKLFLLITIFQFLLLCKSDKLKRPYYIRGLMKYSFVSMCNTLSEAAYYVMPVCKT